MPNASKWAKQQILKPSHAQTIDLRVSPQSIVTELTLILFDLFPFPALYPRPTSTGHFTEGSVLANINNHYKSSSTL